MRESLGALARRASMPLSTATLKNERFVVAWFCFANPIPRSQREGRQGKYLRLSQIIPNLLFSTKPLSLMKSIYYNACQSLLKRPGWHGWFLAASPCRISKWESPVSSSHFDDFPAFSIALSCRAILSLARFSLVLTMRHLVEKNGQETSPQANFFAR